MFFTRKTKAEIAELELAKKRLDYLVSIFPTFQYIYEVSSERIDAYYRAKENQIKDLEEIQKLQEITESLLKK